MIKKQQKWIALLVTLTFVWLLQVSTMPMAAASAPEQISSANTEQAPRFIEEEGDIGSPVKKKSILPIILIGVGVVAVAAVLFLVVLKTKYDIMGTWDVNFTGFSGLSSFTMIFSGARKTGTWTLSGWTDIGTYTVDGKNVQFQFSGEDWIWIGTFTGKDTMSGNHTWNSQGISGTWTATRVATSTETGKLPMVNRSVKELLK